jgi:RNA polymerase sigma factor (TIGR02999 family)
MSSASDDAGQKASPAGTDFLAALRSERPESLDSLVALLYQELRIIAHRHLAKQRRLGDGQHTLATTALVNEAYVKLVDQTQARWNDRAHFLAVATVAMRHILIDRARARVAQKRGGARSPITLEEEALAAEDSPEALLAINDALERLAKIDPRLARVVECRFFGGLTENETAAALGVTVRTVQRDWAKARMLLRLTLAE